MENIFYARIIHGSNLFGTNTPSSDMDIKSVVQPSVEQILLGKVNWSMAIGADSSRANTKDDTDDERHDLLRYMQLITTGQPMALEMLFAPDRFHIQPPHSVWRELQANSSILISRKSDKFLGYCRQQAMSHGMKGDRLDAAEKTLRILVSLIETEGGKKLLKNYMQVIIDTVNSEHVSKVMRGSANGKELEHLKIANKVAPSTITLSDTKDICDNVVNGYGKRARLAKEGKGKDWKALSHALRIGYEAVELFETSHITFPRPEAAYLLEVKQGLVDPDVVGEEIEQLLYKVEEASEKSSLPDAPDVDYMNNLVVDVYGHAVAHEFIKNMVNEDNNQLLP